MLDSILKVTIILLLLCQAYSRLTYVNEDSDNGSFMRRSKKLYEDALESLPNPHLPKEFQGEPSSTKMRFMQVAEVNW